MEEERLRRCPVSGGVDRERERVLGSRRSGLGPLCCDSWEKTGWLSTCGGVAGGVECPEALLVLENILMLAEGVALDEERKMPLKLRRRGDLGEEVWWEGYGNIVRGEVFGCTGAD